MSPHDDAALVGRGASTGTLTREPAAAEAGEVIVLRARRGWIAVDWRELWSHRELLGFLVLRDIKVRYKQTALGVAWAVMQPVMAMAVFSLIFGRFAKIPSDGLPYPLFVFAGLLPWTFFAGGVNNAAQSLVNQEALLTKIYLPRMFVPAAPIGGAFVDLLIALGVFACLMVWYGVVPGVGILLLPVLVAILVAAALGTGLLFAALTVTYRDFRFVIPFMMQIWMYGSPVIYPPSMLPGDYHGLLAVNPMFGIIGGFRAALLDQPVPFGALGVSAAAAAALLLFGLFLFRRMERRFADIA